MFRLALTIAAAIACAFASTAAIAVDYVDTDSQFKVVIPTGWTSDKPSDATFSLRLGSPRTAQSHARCILGRLTSDATRSMSQTEVNEMFEKAIDEAFWRGIVEDKDTKDIVIETASELKNGRRVFRAIARFTSHATGEDVKGQGRFVMHVMPGATFTGMCAVLEEFAAVEDADLRTILETFEPLPGLVASLPPKSAPVFKPARLTLFAGPRLDGPRHELTEDAPSLAQAGWAGATGSLKVTGYGLWQICDGVAFRGNCRLVYGAEGVAYSDRALRIGSARRVVDPRDPRNMLGVVSEGFMTQFKQATRPH